MSRSHTLTDGEILPHGSLLAHPVSPNTLHIDRSVYFFSQLGHHCLLGRCGVLSSAPQASRAPWFIVFEDVVVLIIVLGIIDRSGAPFGRSCSWRDDRCWRNDWCEERVAICSDARSVARNESLGSHGRGYGLALDASPSENSGRSSPAGVDRATNHQHTRVRLLCRFR